MAQRETILIVDDANGPTDYSTPLIVIGVLLGTLIIFLIARRRTIDRRRAGEKQHLEVEVTRSGHLETHERPDRDA
jgi:hypothetical protein